MRRPNLGTGSGVGRLASRHAAPDDVQDEEGAGAGAGAGVVAGVAAVSVSSSRFREVRADGAREEPARSSSDAWPQYWSSLGHAICLRMQKTQQNLNIRAGQSHSVLQLGRFTIQCRKRRFRNIKRYCVAQCQSRFHVCEEQVDVLCWLGEGRFKWSKEMVRIDVPQSSGDRTLIDKLK